MVEIATLAMSSLQSNVEMAAVQWVITYLIHSSLLIAGVWTVTKVIRRISLSTQESLWKAALFGGVATSLLQLSLGLQSPLGPLELPLALESAPTDVVVPAEVPPAGPPLQREITKHRTGDMTITTVVERKPVSSDVVAPVTASHPGSVWPWVLLGLLAVGSTFCVGRLLMASRRLRTRLRERREVVEDPLLESFLRLADEAGFNAPDKKDKTRRSRSLKLTASTNIASPLALRREIVVPERAIVELSRPQQQAMLAHEMAHVVRRDPTWRLLIAAVEAALFFQPLNVLARKKLHELSEYQADEWAAEYTGSGAHLAKAIAAVAGWVERGSKQEPLAATMAAGSSVVRRVRRLTRFTRDTRRQSQGWFAARAGGVLSMLGLTLWLAPSTTRAGSRTIVGTPVEEGSASSLAAALTEASRTGPAIVVDDVTDEDGHERARVRMENEDEVVRVEIERDPRPPALPEPSTHSRVHIVIGGSYDAWGFGRAFGVLDIDIEEGGSTDSSRSAWDLFGDVDGDRDRRARVQERVDRARQRALRRAASARARAEKRAQRAWERARRARHDADDGARARQSPVDDVFRL